jgi:hypothetical protein
LCRRRGTTKQFLEIHNRFNAMFRPFWLTGSRNYAAGLSDDAVERGHRPFPRIIRSGSSENETPANPGRFEADAAF